jgi:hypothetical protein
VASKRALRARFSRLERLDGVTEQERGYELERLLLDLARLEGAVSRPPFRSGGEQIDGLILHDRRPFLVESKWIADPVPASLVYSFRSKVEGKLVGTIGLFVSMRGFSREVPDVLRYGKELNVLLIDGDDVRLALTERHRLLDVIDTKILRAAQYGEVYYTYQRHLDEMKA